MSHPLITIGVTTYDRPILLRDCIASILSQTYENIEIIIANDYVQVPVTFETMKIKPDPRVRIVNHGRNLGAFENNHFLPRAASGEWFTWLADDDLMHTEFLRLASETFSAFPIVAVFADYVAATSPEGVFPKPLHCTKPRIFGGNEFFSDYTARRFRTVGNYGVFHRKVFEQFRQIRRFGTGLPVYADTFLPLFAASQGDVAFIDQPLIFLRTHAESRSASSVQFTDYASAQHDFVLAFKGCCEHLESYEQVPQYLSNMVRWFAPDSWAVICRAENSILRRIFCFVKYAAGVLLPMVDRSRRPILALGMAGMICADSARYLASVFLREIRRDS